MSMTPLERVEAVLWGHGPDHVPFTVYESKLPPCAVERQLRNEGLCIHNRHYTPMKSVTPNCSVETHTYTPPPQTGDVYAGETLVKTTTRTPAGDLIAVNKPAGFTSWRVELPFKTADDYPALIALAEDTQFLPDHETYEKALAWMGDDVILRATLGYSPLQAIIYNLMGVETFCIEWAERRDRVMELYEALAARDRRAFEVLATGPCPYVQYCGNVSPQIVGRERFRELILPLYDEFGAMLHEHGKLFGCHLDADCGLLADLIGESELDFIEAFTPAPDTDMSIADARRAWPCKILWANFPSSVHLADQEQIYATACQMIDEDGGSQKLIIGITEDVPEDRWQENFLTINRACREYGRYD